MLKKYLLLPQSSFFLCVYKDQTNIWGQFLTDIKNKSSSGKQTQTKVFLVGSIFGGTGASGFPTLGRLIAKELNDNANKIKLGGLLMLPYFEFDDRNSEQEIYAKSQEFTLKTEAALRYYGLNDLGLNPVYLLGTPGLKKIKDKDFSSGGSDQRNHPHFIEVFAGLALRDFMFNEQSPVVRINRNDPNSITWTDLPEADLVKVKLINATRFAKEC
jgi:hypothetical protein